MNNAADTNDFHEVILCGYWRKVREYIDLLSASGITVRCIVRHPNDSDLPVQLRWKDMYRNLGIYMTRQPIEPDQYMRSGYQHERVPVIVMPGEHTIEGQDFLSRFELACDIFPPDVKLLHAAALIRHIRPAFNGLWAIAGYPGSGNVLLQNIASRLAPGIDQDRLGERESLAMELAHDHAMATRRYIEKIMQMTGGTDYTVGHGRSERVSTRVSLDDGGYFVIDNLPYCGYLGHNFGGHTYLVERVVSLLSDFGYRWLLCVRNPFNMIFSLAAKTARPPQSVLYDKAWFNTQCASSAPWMHALKKFVSRFPVFKFEDTLSDPIGQVLRLAAYLDVHVTREDAEHIWSEVGFKELTPGQAEHLFDPTTPKISYFTPNLVEKMKQAGYEEICEALGYSWPETQHTALEEAAVKAEQKVPPVVKAERKVSPLYGQIPGSKEFIYFRKSMSIMGIGSSSESVALFVKDIVHGERFRRFYDLLGPLKTDLLEWNDEK